MDPNPEDDFNRFRYRTRVQAVAVIDILVGTIPFISLAFDFNDKDLAEQWKDRENLVLLWTVLLCVYVLQLIMGVWLLAATREVHSEFCIGNCQIWFYVAMFTFVFYTGEMAYAISSIVNAPTNSRSIKSVLATLIYHAAKIIYRAFTLMIVNNFLYDICRPVCKFLSQGSYQYKYYYHARLGTPLPSRRMSMAAMSAYPIQANNLNYTYYSTFPQPHNKLVVQHPQPRPPPPSPRPAPAPVFASRTPYHHYRPPYPNCSSNVQLNRNYVYQAGIRPQ